MPSLLIRNLPARTVARLKARAKSAHRSVEAEVRALLEEQVHALSVQEWIAGTEVLRKRIAAYQKKHRVTPLDYVAILRRDRRSH